jgi:hypothetical protein
MPTIHEEGQREHLDAGMALHEVADRLGGEHDQRDGRHHRRHHHGQVVDHAHGGDHRIQREHDVDDRDLADH